MNRFTPTTTLDPALSLPTPKPAAASLSEPRLDWVVRARELGVHLAARARENDAADTFVHENYVELKAARIMSAGIPTSLGGGGASYEDMASMIRVLARYCGSTALALSMHLHSVAVLVWNWKHVHAPVGALLERIAREQLVLVSSGASDFLLGSGHAEAVEGGFRVSGRKTFASGSPAGDLLLTMAIFEDPQAGPTILHFPVDLHHPQVRIIPTWHALGMRGTGSHDIHLENVFIPASVVSVRRPRGRWHPSVHLAAKIALPLVYSAYVGLAEAARDLALREARPKRDRGAISYVAGEMETALFTARLAHQRMLEIGSREQPGPETTNAALMARTLVAQATIRTVEKAMEVVGGRAFYRELGLERIYRDVQAARFHPLHEKPQQEYTGRLALGLDVDAA